MQTIDSYIHVLDLVFIILLADYNESLKESFIS